VGLKMAEDLLVRDRMIEGVLEEYMKKDKEEV
jgi:hypothetical protein